MAGTEAGGTHTHVLNRGGRGVQSPADRLLEDGALGREARRPNTPRMMVRELAALADLRETQRSYGQRIHFQRRLTGH
jgi:hypothetical protein